MDMMGRLQEMQRKVEETKKRLDTVYVKGESPDGNVTITVSANRQVKEINIAEGFELNDKEEIEDLMLVAMNRALEEAEKVHEAEMAGTAKGMLPGM